MENRDILSVLADVPIFKGLDKQHLKIVADSVQTIKLKKRGFVFHKGDLCKGLYIIARGTVKSAFFSPEGKEHVVRIMDTGESFADSVIFIDEPHSASAQAISDAQILFISKETIFKCMDENPSLARCMLQGLSKRLHNQNVEREAITLHSSMQRVVGYLLKSKDSSQPDLGKRFVILPANRSTIAAHLNMTPETFSRILNTLVEEELISQSGNVIQLLQMEKLSLMIFRY